jgi:hypothetical protein
LFLTSDFLPRLLFVCRLHHPGRRALSSPDLGNQSNPTCDGRNVAAYLDSKFKGNATNGKARNCVPTATATDVLFQARVGQTAITVQFCPTRNSIFVLIIDTQYSGRS